MDYVLLLLGVALGGAAVWLIMRAKIQALPGSPELVQNLQAQVMELTAGLRAESEKCRERGDRLAAAEATLNEKRREIVDLSSRLSSEKAVAEQAALQKRHLEERFSTREEELRVKLAELDAVRRELSVREARFDALVREHERANADCSAFERETGELTAENTSLQRQLAELCAQKQSLEEKLITQKAEIEEIRKRSEIEFRNIANQILEDKSARFTELNRSNLESILKPLGDNIEGFKQKVQEVYEKESKERFSLGKEVEKLVQANQKISEEANNLTRALKGDAKKQGDWGQVILERILECSGLVKDREYVVQEFLRDDDGNTLKNDDGARLQPDVIINYPDNRKVIIDSKVSLVAYERYASADSAEDQDRAVQEHLRSVRAHIDELSAKSYQDFAPSLDFVMMFVPIEPAYLVAINKDHELWAYAYTKRIILISPTNLIAALKLVADLWKREYQNRNALEIAERGGQLYDKLVGFVENLGEVGESIGRAQKHYEKAYRQLRDGNGNLIWQAQKLKELGAKARKALPAQLLSEASGEGQGTGGDQAASDGQDDPDSRTE